MSKKIENLQTGQLEVAGHSQRLAAENLTLNKEVERLKHLHQVRSIPDWN